MNNRLTIVGPEASGEEPFINRLTKVNIESLLLMAKYDPAFCEQLLDHREEALGESGISFSPAERALLLRLPRERLRKNISEFSMPGITEKSLPDWRKAAAVILLVTSIMFTGIDCSRSITAAKTAAITEGWVDENTFRVTAMGPPKSGLTDIRQRKATAREAAVIMAQHRILEKFRGARIEGAGGMVDFATEGITVHKRFGGLVKGGKIVKEEFDQEQNCQIVYEISAKKLKKMVNDMPY